MKSLEFFIAGKTTTHNFLFF